MGHTGIYMGDGTEADARGYAYGVKHVDVDSYGCAFACGVWRGEQSHPAQYALTQKDGR